jgi:hypothetical protein
MKAPIPLQISGQCCSPRQVFASARGLGLKDYGDCNGGIKAAQHGLPDGYLAIWIVSCRVRSMGEPTKERLLQLCEFVPDERDPKKLLSLTEEMNRLLEEKEEERI